MPLARGMFPRYTCRLPKRVDPVRRGGPCDGSLQTKPGSGARSDFGLPLIGVSADSIENPMSQTHSILKTDDGRRLAYRKVVPSGARGARPGVVFLGGLCSDMSGTKAEFLDAWARETNHAFLRFDYTGHGESSGHFEEGCVGDWATDAADAINALTDGPQVLVGSSLGGWIALLLARDKQVKAAAVVGIAAAPDFTERLIREEMKPEERAELLERGRVEIGSDYDSPYVITNRLIRDGTRQRLLHKPCPIPGPVRLLHGTADRDVPVDTALRTLGRLESNDARLVLVKDADHRMSGDAELNLLRETLCEVLALAG